MLQNEQIHMQIFLVFGLTKEKRMRKKKKQKTVDAIFSQTTPMIHPLNTGRKYSKELR